MLSIGYLQQLQRYLILQLRSPFPDERPREIQKKLRVVGRELERLMFHEG